MIFDELPMTLVSIINEVLIRVLRFNIDQKDKLDKNLRIKLNLKLI